MTLDRRQQITRQDTSAIRLQFPGVSGVNGPGAWHLEEETKERREGGFKTERSGRRMSNLYGKGLCDEEIARNPSPPHDTAL